MRFAHECYRRGCRKRPTYGVRGSRKRELCAKHAQPGMINVDVARFVVGLVVPPPTSCFFLVAHVEIQREFLRVAMHVERLFT